MPGIRFYTLFLNAEDMHLSKDVGQLPFYMQHKFGYKSFLVTYKNGIYNHLSSETPGLTLQFVPKSGFGMILDGFRFLWKSRKDIDVLNLYHLNIRSFFWIAFFKLIKRKNAVTYLKLDASHYEPEKVRKRDVRGMVKRITLAMADIVSAESTIMQGELQPYRRKKILYIPNGYTKQMASAAETGLQSNLILTVGRLGTYQKATEVLLEAYALSGVYHEWDMSLVGKAEDNFQIYIKTFLADHPELKGHIFLEGPVYNRETLKQKYHAAGIFVLPSRYEGFPLVLLEAMLAGCYIITTDTVLPAFDLLNDTDFGSIVQSGSAAALAESIRDSCRFFSNAQDRAAKADKIRAYARHAFQWETLLTPLDKEISFIRNLTNGAT